MPRTSSQHTPSAFVVAGAGAAGGRGTEMATSGQVSAGAQSTAQQAVDAVMKVADAQATSASSNGQVVNLGFDFGDDHLSVRVEMKNGEVHARFTSSSPELREAVATQWSSSMNSGSDNQGQRSFHFANPEFVSTGSDGNSGNSGASFSFQGGNAGNEQSSPSFTGRTAASSSASAAARACSKRAKISRW